MSQITATVYTCIFYYIKEMKAWLESVVDALQSDGTERTIELLASALCVTHCLPKIGIYNLKMERFALPLLKMLHLKPDLERKECFEYMHLCEILPKNYR